MKNPAQKKYFKKRERSMLSLLKKTEKTFTVEDFHQLRVEIKKLKALFKLAGFCLNDFDRKKIFRPLKQLFRQAGKVRETQLEEAIIKKHAIRRLPQKYLELLQRRRLK